MKLNHISRRKFLKSAGFAAFGMTTFSTSLFKLNSIKAAAATTGAISDDYKALVCLFKAGGNDSFNMLMPVSPIEHAIYSATRTNLAIPIEDILEINPVTANATKYGVHPSMSGVQDLFNERKLSFVSNLGPMIHPVTKEEFESDTVPVPLGLFSHSDQIAHWETGNPGERINYGWGGRLADMFYESNQNSALSMNISMSGSNLFQAGQSILGYTVNPNDIGFGIDGYLKNDDFNHARTRMIDSLLTCEYEDVFKRTYVDVINNSKVAQEEFNHALEEVPDFQTEFSANSLSQSFRTIARIIGARESLGTNRQIFFIRVGGWDNHDDLLSNQNGLLGMVSNGMAQFASALEEIDAFDQVMTFTMSEFARTLTSNGNGSDHAWGGNVMVMGDMIKGGEIFGSYPNLELGNPLDLGRGRLIPTLSNDEYFAELAMWFGVAPSELNTIFPNVGNFYSVGSGDMPIGFLDI